MLLINVNHSTTKSYRTKDAAINAIKKIEESNKEHFIVIIAACDNGRFSPVIVLNEKQMVYAAALARQGFTVTRA